MPTVQVVAVFILGLVLGAVILHASIRFRKSIGVIVMTETEQGPLYSLQLEEEPEELMKKRYVLFKVSKRSQ